MALDVRTKPREMPRTELRAPSRIERGDASRSGPSSTRTRTSTSSTSSSSSTSTSSSSSSSTARSSSAVSDRSASRPTLATSLDARARLRADSGAGQRAFLLNRQLDAGDRPADVVPLTAKNAAGDRLARSTRAFRLEGEGSGSTTPPAPMTGEQAIAVLDRDFDTFDTANQGGSTDGKVSNDDLRAVAENRGGSFTDEQRDAAQFLLDSTAYRSFVDVGAGRGSVDGTISRDDVDGAQATIATGSHYDELLDTANGRGGRDGHVSRDDVVAALSDPGLSPESKDALNLMLLGSDGSEDLGGALGALSTSEVEAASDLYRSPEFTALSGTDKRLAADAFRDSGGDAAVTSELSTLIEGDAFQRGTAEEKTAALSRVALLSSTEFEALPSSDQDLVRDALSGADATDLAMPGAMLHLIRDPNFQDLSAAEKTSILSQSNNYPDSRAVSNLDRMIDRDWYQDQSTEDKQRSAKLVAHLSVDEDGDREIVENTLERFLASDSDYRLEWEAIDAEGGNVTFGHASGDTLTLNANLVAANNDPVAAGDEARVIENTTAHEVSHLVNGDRTDQTFEYLNEEYRAWYVGYEAEHGHPPSNQEAMDRWEYFLNPNGGYSDYAYGTDSWLPLGIGDKPGALEKPEEAAKIYDLLSQLSGVEVTEDNYRDVMADPSTWATNPADPASDDVFPAGDDLDN